MSILVHFEYFITGEGFGVGVAQAAGEDLREQ